MTEQIKQNKQAPLKYINKWSLYLRPVKVAAIIDSDWTYFNLYLQFVTLSNTIYAVLTLGEYTQPGKPLSVPLEHQDNVALKIMTRWSPRSMVKMVADKYASIRHEKLRHRFTEVCPGYTVFKAYVGKSFDELLSIDSVRADH